MLALAFSISSELLIGQLQRTDKPKLCLRLLIVILTIIKYRITCSNLRKIQSSLHVAYFEHCFQRLVLQGLYNSGQNCVCNFQHASVGLAAFSSRFRLNHSVSETEYDLEFSLFNEISVEIPSFISSSMALTDVVIFVSE